MWAAGIWHTVREREAVKVDGPDFLWRTVTGENGIRPKTQALILKLKAHTNSVGTTNLVAFRELPKKNFTIRRIRRFSIQKAKLFLNAVFVFDKL